MHKIFAFAFVFLFALTLVSAGEFGYNVLENSGVAYGELKGSDIGEIAIAVQDTYYNITNTTKGASKGVSISNGILTIESAGDYLINSGFSFSGSPNNEYHLTLGVNGVSAEHCHSERVIGTGGDVGFAGYSCIENFESGDRLIPMIENVDGTGNPTIHNINLNVVRLI